MSELGFPFYEKFTAFRIESAVPVHTQKQKMARIVLKHLTGSRANTTEIYPTNRFQSLYLGRDPSCDVQFDADKDDLVSRSHAVIEWEEDDPTELTLSDLLSSNGTFLNDERVHGAVPLKSGDQVKLGSTGPSMTVVRAPERRPATVHGSQIQIGMMRKSFGHPR
jgi:pSer/pThr/pTyr-binding forkhead associated (FHA) protein